MTLSMAPRGAAGFNSGMGSAGMQNKIPKGHELARVQNFTPEQMQLFQQMFGNVGPESFLGKLAGGSQEGFEQLEAPAFRNLEQAMGAAANRFSNFGAGMGGGGGRQMSAQRGSGFQNALGSLGKDFAMDLQSQRMGIQRQALQDLMNMSGNLLQQRPFEQSLIKKGPDFLQQLLGSAIGGVGKGISSGLSGGISDLIGGLFK